jgi:hypothetical protein
VSFFTALRWWWALPSAEKIALGISDNKVVESSFRIFVLWCGIRRLPSSFFDMLPRRKDGVKSFGAGSGNKRLLLLCDARARLFFLAGLGGEGEEGDSSVAAVYWRWWREFAKTAVAATVPKRRRLPAAAILDQELGLAALKHKILEHIILFRRIFSSLVMASSTRSAPSGHVPGGGRGGHVWRLFFIGGQQLLDRFSVICCRVLYAKPKVYGCIFFFL